MEAIRVLIADDSRVVRMMVREILERDAGIEVVAEAANGREAVDLTLRLCPDLLVLDIMMPVLDGLQAIEEIMARRPTPILVLSGHVDPEDSRCAFKAISLGALDVMVKAETVCEERFSTQLIEKVKFLAGIRVLHHFRGGRRAARKEPPPADGARRVLAVGASTGGPKAIQYLLRNIPPQSRPRIVIVQHIAPGFAAGFARWLGEECPFRVRVAREGDPLEEGVALIAPEGAHLEVRDGRVRLTDAPAVNSCRPSIDVLFASLAPVAPSVVALLLTGMGRDGAAGLLRLKEAGAFTMVQDEATSTIYGMPAAAVALGAAHRILPLEQIPEAVDALLEKKDRKASPPPRPVL